MKTYKQNLSHRFVFSMNMGEIIPFCHEEILPNDLIEMSVDGLIKFTPMVRPLMHTIKAHFMWVFVPTRIIDDTFEDFITGGVDGLDTTTLPTISTGTAAKKTNYHYLGVPKVDNLTFSAHPVRAYNLAYNELFRDPDLEQTEVAASSTAIQYVMFEKDYFTAARPQPTKGNAVTISIGTQAPIEGIGGQAAPQVGPINSRETDGVSHSYANYWNSTTQAILMEDSDGDGFPNVYANLTNTTGMTLEDLKYAIATDRYQENRYKYGSRFVEYCRFLGGNVGDARLQRPELIGSSSSNISISEIIQTSPDTAEGTVVGEQRGHRQTGIRGRRAIKHFGEHGHLLGLMFIRPESVYTNGLPKKFSRIDKEDYYQPEFADLGWQAIKNKEIYAQGTAGGTDDDDTYAYTPKYDEYKSNPNRVAGDFIDIEDNWHLARQFTGLPVLNKATISTENNIRNADVFASVVTDTIHVIVNNRLKARRIVTPREPLTFIRK